MVLFYSLCEDAELWLVQYPPYWQLPVPEGWMLLFTRTLWQAVWRLLDHKSSAAALPIVRTCQRGRGLAQLIQ